jgi:hypothetical protein
MGNDVSDTPILNNRWLLKSKGNYLGITFKYEPVEMER